MALICSESFSLYIFSDPGRKGHMEPEGRVRAQHDLDMQKVAMVEIWFKITCKYCRR